MGGRLYLRVPPCAPATEVAVFARECEEAGLSGVGFIDSQLLAREVFSTMAAAALATSRIRLASAVANPVTRHVSVLASAAKTVEELAPGRVDLWIGRGLTAVQTIGEAMASLALTREVVSPLRKLLTGEAVDFGGVSSQMRHGGGRHLPVYLAASGPQMLRLAGAVADGVVVRVGIHPQAIAEARGYVDEGAREAGRDPAEVPLVACATTVIEDDLDAARERARPMAVQWLMKESLARWLRAAGVKTDELELPRELWDLYPDVAHAVDQQRARELCAFLSSDVLPQICDTLGLIGTPAHCARLAQGAVASGLDRLYLMGESTYEFPYPELAACREAIIPALVAT